MKPENHGFVILHRQIRKHPYWDDAERLKAWIDILLMAAWEDHRRLVGIHQVTIKRGEFLASIRFLAKRWRWSPGKVERFLKAAQEMNEIRVTNQGTDGYTYLVVNYDTYQTKRDRHGYSNGTPTGTATVQREQVVTKKNKRGPLPEGWEPTENHHLIAKAEGVNISRELDKFKDHAAGENWLKIDWDATFRNWIRRAAEYSRHDSGRTPGRDTSSNASLRRSAV